jgi:hypothetical protein
MCLGETIASEETRVVGLFMQINQDGHTLLGQTGEARRLLGVCATGEASMLDPDEFTGRFCPHYVTSGRFYTIRLCDASS